MKIAALAHRSRNWKLTVSLCTDCNSVPIATRVVQRNYLYPVGATAYRLENHDKLQLKRSDSVQLLYASHKTTFGLDMFENDNFFQRFSHL
jgi:hypothetical protein